MGMVDNSCSRGCGFKSQHCILDGHFFAWICCKNCIVCLKRPKWNEKEAGVDPFFKKRFKCKLGDHPQIRDETLMTLSVIVIFKSQTRPLLVYFRQIL